MRRKLALVGAMIIAATWGQSTGTAAAEPDRTTGEAAIVNTRVVDDRQLDIEVYSPSMDDIVALRVLRPIDTSTPQPTLYLLSGVDGGSAKNTWISKTDIVDFFADKAVNVVIPAGGEASYYADWKNEDPALGHYMWSTFLTEELPPLIDAAYDTTGVNGVIGFSMSGTSSLNLAIRDPELYSAVGSFSGCARTSDPMGQAFVTTTVANFFGNATNMWGNYDDELWVENDPYVNAEKLRGTALYLSTRTGLPGRHDHLGSPWIRDEENMVDVLLKGGLIEAATADCTRRMAARLDELDIPAVVHLDEPGTHNWGYWQDDLHRSWPVLGPALGVE